VSATLCAANFSTFASYSARFTSKAASPQLLPQLGRPDKVGNHWAAFSKNLARLAAEGVAERDSWTIRVLRLP
jgi:hypothetical protein